GPAHELGTRIVRISIRVEEVSEGKSSYSDAVSFQRPGPSELISLTLHRFGFMGEADVLGDVGSRQIGFWRGCIDTRKFAVICIRQPVHVTETTAAGDFRIDVELRIPGKAESYK